MREYAMPELIWPDSYSRRIQRLPIALLPALKRWVTLGTMATDQEARLSRLTGGRC